MWRSLCAAGVLAVACSVLFPVWLATSAPAHLVSTPAVAPVEALSPGWVVLNARTAQTAAETTPQPAPDQQLPPGAVKQPGEKCATTIQPPDGYGCPGRPGDTAYCTGSAFQRGECLAAEAGFFSQVHFPGRSGTERCIISRENGGSYDRSSNPSHFGRYQFGSIWYSYGGQADWGYASAGEQDRVFVRAMDAGGAGNWTPYDHC